MLIRAAVVWLAMVPLAVLNGAVREFLLNRWLGARGGHVASALLLCGGIFLVAWLTVRWMRPKSTADALRIGAAWLLLTLAFEFLVGHYVFGAPWGKLLGDYNVVQGRVWVLVLASVTAAPALMQKRRHG